MTSEESHRSPDCVAVLTGNDSDSRNYVTEQFRGPGNPFVLILTHVCQLGVDLHPFCWDVLHYSPAWTPHEAEQKTGRIDRPRLPDTLSLLNLGPRSNSDRIRIHHMIWPFTYDERIFSRLNLRSQYAERLLGSKVKKDAEDSLAANLIRFRPLRLEAT